jgi:hypothetical protein
MQTLTLAGRKEGLISDAMNNLVGDSGITNQEKLAALHRIHDEADMRIETIEEQIRISEGGDEAPPPEGGERHRYKKEE